MKGGTFLEVTKKEREILERKHIHNNYHLRRWFPIRYIDNSRETGLIHDQHCCIIGTVVSTEECEMKKRKGSYLKIKVKERISDQYVTIMIFGRKSSFHYYHLLKGAEVFLSGKGKFDPIYGWSLNSPEVFERLSPDSFKIIPVYSALGTIYENRVKSIIKSAFDEKEEETVPLWMLDRYHIPYINDGLRYIMMPETIQEIHYGQLRILFDDLFYLASQFVLSERKNQNACSLNLISTDLMYKVIQSFPYKLTKGQMETVVQIVEKMKSGKLVRALVQGDVGCGKTITGFLPMIAAAENGIQACMVAPTKNLAKQHYQKLTELLEGTGIEVGLFSGDTIKKSGLTALKNGKIKIAVGTHSLISDRIEFENLGLIVIDEEHKFGVAQRNKLIEKSESVNTISMSATPIPRTLARALYGNDTEIFSIRDMPGGRKLVQTYYDDGRSREPWVKYILDQGQQVYVICPAIEESMSNVQQNVLSISEAYTLYSRLFPDKKIAMFDGKMKPAEADRILNEFRNGDIDILIATTVVEVGIDVPNATLILIENAERFGLSQLHQLRGRVGRGNLQSYCMLISQDQENQRLLTLCQISDGFEIARIDLEQLRNSGNLFGEEQSGFNIYVEEMLRYQDAYQKILNDARTLSDQVLQAHINKTAISEIYGKKRNFFKKQQD